MCIWTLVSSTYSLPPVEPGRSSMGVHSIVIYQTTNTDSVSLYSYLAFLDLQRNGELLKAHNVEVE